MNPVKSCKVMWYLLHYNQVAICLKKCCFRYTFKKRIFKNDLIENESKETFLLRSITFQQYIQLEHSSEALRQRKGHLITIIEKIIRRILNNSHLTPSYAFHILHRSIHCVFPWISALKFLLPMEVILDMFHQTCYLHSNTQVSQVDLSLGKRMTFQN